MTDIAQSVSLYRLPSSECLSDVTEVHLWLGFVEPGFDEDAQCALLDERERDRAARFRTARNHARFINRRAFARRILAGYLGTAPAVIQIWTSYRGRPQWGSSSPCQR